MYNNSYACPIAERRERPERRFPNVNRAIAAIEYLEKRNGR